MKRERNRSKMKEQGKSPEKELSDMEASKLPGTEFKTMVIRMLKELTENFNSIKKHGNHKKDPLRNEGCSN